MDTEDLYWVSFTLVTVVGYYTFKLLTRYRSFFKARGVAYEKPHFIYGNLLEVNSGKLSSLELIADFYQKFKNERVFGFFNYLTPVYYIRDPELVRKLWVHEFDSFSNHAYFLDESKDPILGNQLHLMKDEKWRQMRHTLRPVFAGQSVALMSSLIRTNSLDLVDYLKASVDSELEFKGVFQKYTFNVIASCAFGLELNTFKDESDKFCTYGSALVTGTNPVQTMKTIFFYLFPKLMTRMKVRLMEEEHATYFMDLVQSTMSDRVKKNLSRPDMIQMLHQANKGELKAEDEVDEFLQMKDFSKRKWDEEELVAQCVAFFGTGFEGLVNLFSFAAYELAANPEVQQKLLEEIENSLEDSPVVYHTVVKLPYLEMVVSETLRKWPAVPSSDRECSQDFLLDDEGLRVQFKKGDTLWVSIWALHRDENYFPDPELFDPERFSVANKGNITPYTYMPYGAGPRNCIGMRLVSLAIKITLVDLVKNFKLALGTRMVQPLRLSKTSYSMEPEGGFWLQMTPR
ncbi:probable cytochrome P450 9f2 [Ochlerotatus camptorhynchus]|uniref:probable cytochrome P450 9f2 n=1 Tax=Ochlerotatus camptorhynchus TaxID=644619 RepID=UPI0031E0D9BB